MQAPFLLVEKSIDFLDQVHQLLGILLVSSLLAELHPVFFAFAFQVSTSREI
jgi:hypothetical protein